MKGKIGCLLLVVIISVLGLNTNVSGKSLKVSPADYTWSGIKLDTKQEMPEHITVLNDSSRPRSYSIKVIKNKFLNVLEEGSFKELPDPSWVSFDADTFEIPSGRKRDIRVFLEIPEKKVFNSGSWMFYVEVREKQEGRETVVLACYPKIYISLQNQRK